MVCRNPLLAEERARKRAALLDDRGGARTDCRGDAAEKRRLSGESKIGARVGKVIGGTMAKHFEWSIDEKGGDLRLVDCCRGGARSDCAYQRARPRLILRAYKRLVRWSGPSAASRPWRSGRSSIARRASPAHVLLCMLAYYVEWHMRQRLSSMLFDDEDREAAEAARTSIVAPASVGHRTSQGRALPRATRCRASAPCSPTSLPSPDTVAPRLPGAEPFEVITRPTPLRQGPQAPGCAGVFPVTTSFFD